MLAVSVLLAATAALAGCTAPPPVDPAPTDGAVAQPEPTPSITRNPPEPDSILWIRALATAPDGSELSLEAMVHRSVSHAYPGTQTLNQMLLDDCGATLTGAILTADAWSFTRMNITAIPTAGTTPWPEASSVVLRPSADVAYSAGRGMVTADPATGDLACLQDKLFDGEGRGALAVGIPRDTIDQDAFHDTWARHTWGFAAGEGVVLSECSFEITELGREVGAGAADWVEVSDPATCVIGPAVETPTF